MKFIFWQNILSIHQSAFIRNLAQVNNVTIVVEREIDDKRKESGWEIPDFGDAKIIVKPSQQQVESLFVDQSIHVFTGINAFPIVYNAFKIACKKEGTKIWIQSEPYNWVYGKVWLRKLKYLILGVRYKNKIDGILAISSKAKECFIKAKFYKNTIFNWAYFTEIPIVNDKVDNESQNNDLPNIIYVGSLDERKNLLVFLPIIKRNSELFAKFSVYGTGDLITKMKRYEDDKIYFYGNISNTEIFTKIRESDILILPSKFDGWGAVVNEALMVGTRVLCSTNCGSSDLILGNRGEIFNFSKGNFEEKFIKLLQKKKMNKLEKEEIVAWAKNTISGEIAAKYFKSIMDYKYQEGAQKPASPWE